MRWQEKIMLAKETSVQAAIVSKHYVSSDNSPEQSSTSPLITTILYSVNGAQLAQPIEHILTL
jgi:hypothetical protein